MTPNGEQLHLPNQRQKKYQVGFLRYFWNLNMKLKRKPYPMQKNVKMLLNLKDFQYATSLDLNMGYYHIFSKKASNLCMIILIQGKNKYIRLPIGVCNSLKIYRQTEQKFRGIKFIQGYINDLLIITTGNFLITWKHGTNTKIFYRQRA